MKLDVKFPVSLDLRDVLALVGLLLVTIGLALFSVPLALVVAGTVLFGLAILPALPAGNAGPAGR